ncbi:hypothetical protein Tco_1492834 [Tanacetum coccineum]
MVTRFFSKKLSKRMQQASAYVRELYDITEAVAKFHHYLFGHYSYRSTKFATCHRAETPEQEAKTGVKKFYWYDPELDNAWYMGHLYGMYGQLNPHQIQDIATWLSSQEQLIILQDEFAGLQAKLAQTQKNARAKEDDLKVARMINKLCVKLSVANEEHRMFTQELEASPGWVII